MRTFAQIYLPRLHSYQADLLARLQLLVNIDTGTGQSVGVGQVMEYLRAWVSDLGFTAFLRPSGQYRPNLVASRQGQGRMRLLLV